MVAREQLKEEDTLVVFDSWLLSSLPQQTIKLTSRAFLVLKGRQLLM